MAVNRAAPVQAHYPECVSDPARTVRDLLLHQASLIDRILAHPSIDGRLNELLDYAGEHGIPLYVLIDEYDNFANTILAHRGAKAYESFTHGGGFYRNFFATLKAGAGHGGGVERIFITGVSPITMDDVTSGFNIGTNVSLMPEFNEVLGFTAAEVRSILETYRDHGVFDQDVDEALAVMSEWYNGYRFAKRAQQDVYNTDMVLYYLKASVPGRGKPDDLIDTNVRIDYAGMRHGYVIELKYLKRSERFQRGEPASEARVARAAQEAAAQVRRYVADQRLARQYPGVRFTGLAVVYHGWELVHAEAASADR